MGLFGKKEKLQKLPARETANRQASNVFKDKLLEGEIIEKAVSGKCDAENFIFSVGIMATTDKRILYYYQDGSKTGVETIMYEKILSVTSTTGFEKKMGNYIGISVELANGKLRSVRCLSNNENKPLINEMVFSIESHR